MIAKPWPSPSVHDPMDNDIDTWLQEIRQHPPFDRMPVEHLHPLLAGAIGRHFEAGAEVLAPRLGPVESLWLVVHGHVVGRRPLADGKEEVFQLQPGDVFPVAAWTARRPVTARYEAQDGLFMLQLDSGAVADVQQRCVVWADHLQQRARAFLRLAQQRLQAELSARVQEGHALERSLGELPRREPVGLPATATVRQALQTMQQQRIGSILLHTPDGALAGILTRHDVLDRISLAGVDLDRPVSEVMSHPVHCLQAHDSGHDAALLMTQQGIRHVVVLKDGLPVGVVSERDLFALQRLSVRHLSMAMADCHTLPDFQRAAADIRSYARQLMAQGMQARQLTAMVSHLNDRLTQQLIKVHRTEAGLPADGFCWMALGSEGRSEQTLATDQDNALVFDSPEPEAERPRWLAFAQKVNEALDQCGYPLCQGGIMAGNPACCLSRQEWEQRFDRWIDAGGPQELLHAAIFFDLRPLVGRSDWIAALRQRVLDKAKASPRFIRQMAQSHLEHPVPLNWHGGVEGRKEGRHLWFDMKLQGTALLVEGARIVALAHGIAATNTRERLAQAGQVMRVPAEEYEGWISAFDFLQMHRMALQADPSVDSAHPNRIDLRRFNAVDQRVLQASLRAIRTLQQRLTLDYLR
jgi:CBS domain-containing protein